jgi:hypothetical protein
MLKNPPIGMMFSDRRDALAGVIGQKAVMSEGNVCEHCEARATVEVTEVKSGVPCAHHYCDEHVPGVVMPTALARHTRALLSKLEEGPQRHSETVAKLKEVLKDLASALETLSRRRGAQ